MIENNNSKSPNNPLSNFEANSEKLAEIEKKLADSSISLEQSVSLFEQAQSLIKQCQKALDEAELKIKIVQNKADFES